MWFVCPICGYPDLKKAPRSKSGGSSHEMCLSCGFEFGYTDDDQGYSYAEWREKWIAGGMQWHASWMQPPVNWNPEKQLGSIITVP
jgi:hypothetical protein